MICTIFLKNLNSLFFFIILKIASPVLLLLFVCYRCTLSWLLKDVWNVIGDHLSFCRFKGAAKL